MANLTNNSNVGGESQARESAPVDLKPQWLEHLAKAICPSSGLAQIPVPTRERILGEWFKQGDLGFIFGPRGLGKTWLALLLGRKIAEGGCVAHWTVHQPRRVLYVDGEMALDSIRERDAALSTAPADGMFYLQHEALFHLAGQVLNLTKPIVQAALLEKCQQEKIEVLILDNLSCLFSGIKENDADAWEQVLPWLLDLRRNRIAVVFVAHAGRNGFMRGTSRREDAAFWMIQLAEATNGDASAQYSLGIHYLNGQGCEINRDKAIYWLKKAADQGDEEASNKLATIQP